MRVAAGRVGPARRKSFNRGSMDWYDVESTYPRPAVSGSGRPVMDQSARRAHDSSMHDPRPAQPDRSVTDRAWRRRPLTLTLSPQRGQGTQSSPASGPQPGRGNSELSRERGEGTQSFASTTT
jgi:hypothetical protein